MLLEDARALSDEALAARAPRERHLFGVLVERYQEKLGRYVRRLGVPRAEDAEDILQNAFVSAFRNLNGFDPSLSFNAWMYRIAHNEAMTFFRKRKARPEGNAVEDSEAAFERLFSDDDPMENAARSHDAARVSAALRSLPDKDRDVLLLRYFEERDYKEISDILRLPMGSVATLIHRAKKKLAKTLAELV